MAVVLQFPATGELWVERHRDRYFNRQWLRSAKGNRFVRLASSDGRGATVTVFHTSEGWKWSLVRSRLEGPIYARQTYASAVEARAAAWDALAERSMESA